MKSIVKNNQNMKYSEYPCIVCGHFETKYCRDCRRNLCIKCTEGINFVVRKHTVCLECNNKICCFKKVCYKCDNIPYHMITENIGVGSRCSKYDDFDVIVNCDYPENEAKEDEITIQKYNDKMIIHVGLLDSSNKSKKALDYMKKITPVIYKLYKDKKILFHCFAGMSRSPMFAIAYLSYSLKISLEEAHSMVKNKRKFIEINEGFINSLKEFHSWSQNFVYPTD